MKNKHVLFIWLLFFVAIAFFACSGNTANKKNAENEEIADLTSKIKVKPSDALLYFSRAEVYHGLHKDSLAALDYIQAVELDSTKAKYYSAAANVLFNMKDVRSITYINKALQLNPNDITAHLKIATIHFYSKNYPDAFKSINTVLRNDVYNYDAYFLKGMCYKDMGDTVSATSSFQTAARINPENPDPYLQLGLILANTDEKQAKLYLESAFKADTNNVEPLNAIGLIYQGKKENAAAKKEFIRCINAKPGFAKAYYNIGCILIDEDSLPKAQRQFDIAVKHEPQYVEAFFNRGLCKEMQKDIAGALQDYEQALVLNPDFKLAIDGKKRLRK